MIATTATVCFTNVFWSGQMIFLNSDRNPSNHVDELEGIETEQKSEARRLIENFVEENPEAVATLLRNWLDEDWG